MEHLIVNNTKIEYEVRRSARAKRLNIRIKQDKVTVSVPQGVTVTEAKKFVEAKGEWILQHVLDWQSQNQQRQKKYVTGETFLYRGRSYPLSTRGVAGRTITIKFTGDCFWVELPNIVPQEDWPLIVKESLFKWYRVQAKRVFQERLDYFARIMGLLYNRLVIKEQKTRWGSCSSKGNINLNWRIILAPAEVLDYLVVHELAHLRYMNHAPEFWNLVGEYVPDYPIWRKWLKDNASQLRYDGL